MKVNPIRTARKIAQTGILLAAIGANAWAQADTSDSRKVFEERLATFIKDPGNFPYAPMEPLVGTGRWKPLPTASAEQVGIAPDAVETARAYAEAMNSSAFIVWRDGRIEREWYAKGVDARTPLVSKSLSKPLTAIAVGRAMALGKIRSLDQPIADFIPMARGTPKAKITIRYLLDMRSGMLDQGFSPDPAHPYNSALLDTDFGQRIIESYPMPYEPGTRYSYANAPSDLIAMVIEGATGLRYGDFLSREVLRPLGAQGGRIWVGKPGGLAHSGCCTYLPADTYLRLAVLLLDDGKWLNKRLLPKGYVAEMRKGTPQNPNFGLGIWIGEPYHERRGFGAPGTPGPQVLHSEPYLDRDLYLFDGNSNQIVAISPKHRLIVLRVGPTPPAPKDGSAEWDNAFLPNTLIRGLTRGQGIQERRN
jgi:CubicO group peptidase (beta-lactamase class C family)